MTSPSTTLCVAEDTDQVPNMGFDLGACLCGAAITVCWRRIKALSLLRKYSCRHANILLERGVASDVSISNI